MTTPTSDNPYVLFLDEPPGWHNHGNTKPWEDHKKEVQTNNGVWWSKRTEGNNYAHQTETPLTIEGSGFPLGLGNRYGPFIYAPFPLDGKVKWGFQRKDGLDQFLTDVAEDNLPKGGAVPIRPTLTKPVVSAKEADPFASLTDDAAEPEVDPFADLDMGTTSEPVSQDPKTQTQVAAIIQTRDMEAAEEDPFAALDMDAPVTEAVVPEPVSAAPTPPPSPPPVADSVDEEPETDEWGAVIEKTAAPDPFADL